MGASIRFSSKWVFLVLFVLFFVSAFFRFYRLGYPPSYYFDEIYFAFTAQEMAKGNPSVWVPGSKAPEGFAFEWVHPPLGKLIITSALKLFGHTQDPFYWRVGQAFFGCLGLLVVFALAYEIFQNYGVALLASFLYTFDPFPLTLSRISTTDIFLMNFILLASLFIVKFAKSSRFVYLLLSGLFTGCAVSVKWSGVYLIEFFAVVSFFLIVYRGLPVSEGSFGRLFSLGSRAFALSFLAFILLPLAIYLLSYLPYFLAGHGAGEFVDLQKNMFGYHKGVTENHPYSSLWWKWPLMLKPVYLYLGDKGWGEGILLSISGVLTFLKGLYSGGSVHSHIYMFGNPFIWWTGCLFFVAGLLIMWMEENAGLSFLTLSVLAYWLPWGVSPRKVTFIYHFLPSLPFLYIIISYLLIRMSGWARVGRVVLLTYLVVSLAFFVYFFPIFSGMPLRDDLLHYWFWLKSWR
jgi:dolichyl-phosphate-mannose--protein O-mannosyl transferase